MVVVSTKEFRDKQKKYFELAKNERVLIKRGKGYVNLIVTDEINDSFFGNDWMRDFFAIPEEYRCNPFEISPSGDLFWADKRNVEQAKKSIGIGQQQIKEGKFKRFSSVEALDKYLESL
ncbi:hypothetical protein AGMMS50239_27710 [Bacteroidia bacterium]|nr:hypothetical protein AGMMS50239_27710 [Bacteroidia bacterium]